MKNLIPLNGKPLISYIIEATKKADCFDEIYINSESDVFGDIAKDEGISFYKRPLELAQDSATNDDFTLDFVNNIQCDLVVQILPTSPFLSPQEIKDFTNKVVRYHLNFFCKELIKE